MKQPIRKLNGRRPATVAARPLRRVVAALILRENTTSTAETQREVFICQRRPDQPMALKWEFPGGKIELGIDATIGPRITTVRHSYRNGGTIEIEFFTVLHFQGELVNHIFHQMLWTPLTRLPDFDFLAADLTLIRDLAAGKLL